MHSTLEYSRECFCEICCAIEDDQIRDIMEEDDLDEED